MEKFNGTENFGLWQIRVKNLLAQQGCLKALRDAKPAKMDAEDWEELQLQAAGTTRLCLSDQVIYHVMDENLPKKIWMVSIMLMWQLVVMTQTAVVMFSLYQTGGQPKVKCGYSIQLALFMSHPTGSSSLCTSLVNLVQPMRAMTQVIMLLE